MAAPRLPEGYEILSGFPSVPEYRNLRAASGLTPVTEAQARPVPNNSWYGCYVTFTEKDGNVSKVGMGRIMGDGGWYFHIADMAVLPDHQRKGLGDAILKHLMAHIKANAPEGDPYVNLVADPPGRKVYAKNGFVAPRLSAAMEVKTGWHLL